MRQYQRKAGESQMRDSPLDRLALGGELFNDVVMLCQALLVVERGCRVKMVQSEQEATLFLRVVQAKCREASGVTASEAHPRGSDAHSSPQEDRDGDDDEEVVVLDDMQESHEVVDLTDSQDLC